MVILSLGAGTFLASRRDPALPRDNRGLVGFSIGAVLLALTDPLTVFAFVAVSAALGLGHCLAVGSAGPLVLEAFTGSSLWLLTPCSTAMLFRRKLDIGGSCG